MKFLWRTLRVRDLAESVAFYREIVWLEILRQTDGPTGPRIVFLESEGSRVELIRSEDGTAEMGKDVSLGFEVQSIREKTAFLAKRESPRRGAVPSLHTSVFLQAQDSVRRAHLTLRYERQCGRAHGVLSDPARGDAHAVPRNIQ